MALSQIKTNSIATGNITSPLISSSLTTPAQFDNSTTLATTAFVQRALGNIGGIAALNSTTTMTAANCGKVYELYSSATTINLPDSTTCAGGQIILWNYTGTNVTINRQNTDQIYYGNAAANSITLLSGDYVTLTSFSGFWLVTGGAQAFTSTVGAFSNNKAQNGWQRLPSGMILQWGYGTIYTSRTTYSFPTSFSTSNNSVVANAFDTPSVGVYIAISSVGSSSFDACCNAGSGRGFWFLAMGY